MTQLKENEIIQLAQVCGPYIEQKREARKIRQKHNNMTKTLIEIVEEKQVFTTNEFMQSLNEEEKLNLMIELGQCSPLMFVYKAFVLTLCFFHLF